MQLFTLQYIDIANHLIVTISLPNGNIATFKHICQGQLSQQNLDDICTYIAQNLLKLHGFKD